MSSADKNSEKNKIYKFMGKGVPTMEALIFAIAHLCMAGLYVGAYILTTRQG